MKPSLYFRVLIASLLAQAALAKAESACSTLVTPIFGSQIQVMDRRAYEEIRNHPISQLALDLKAKGLVPTFWFDQEELFDLPPSLLGESIQTKMLVRILKAIFPEAKSISRPRMGSKLKLTF